MRPQDIEDRVRRIAWPLPSPELRNRVLSATVQWQPITWSDRVWYSRAWRLSIAGAALTIVVLDYVAGLPRPTGVAPTPNALAQAEAIVETGEQVGLPSDVAASFGRRALSEASASGPSSERATIALPSFEAEAGGGGR
jgi:hypothetical protein